MPDNSPRGPQDTARPRSQGGGADIVERLRARKAFFQNGGIWLMSNELDPEAQKAADEIENLRRQIDIAWAAGLFEGEGAICGAQKYKSVLNADSKRRKSGYRWWIVIHSTDHDVLKKFAAVVGRGLFFGPYPDKRSSEYKPQLRWATTTLEDTQYVLNLLLPYLGKRRQQKARQCLDAKYVRRMRKEAA